MGGGFQLAGYLAGIHCGQFAGGGENGQKTRVPSCLSVHFSQEREVGVVRLGVCGMMLDTQLSNIGIGERDIIEV